MGKSPPSPVSSVPGSAESLSSRSWWSRVFAVPGDLSALFDRVHTFLSNQLVDRSDQIDQFFSDERIEDGAPVALVRVRQDFTGAEGGDFSTRTRVTARIPFPRFERRFRMVIDTSSDEEDLAGEVATTLDEEEERLAGVEVDMLESARARLNLDVGGRFDGGIKLRTEVKIRYSWTMAEWRGQVLQGVGWRDGEGFAERTRLDLDHDIGSFAVARSRTEAEWGERTRGVELEETLSLARALNEKTALSAAVGVAAHTRPSWIVDGYLAEIRLRRQLHRRWLFVEVVPRANFPRDRRYEFTPELVLRLEIRFGGDLDHRITERRRRRREGPSRR